MTSLNDITITTLVWILSYETQKLESSVAREPYHNSRTDMVYHPIIQRKSRKTLSTSCS